MKHDDDDDDDDDDCPLQNAAGSQSMCPPLPGRPAKGCDFASPATAAHLTNLTRNEYSNHQ